jgi:hypothetical protein
MLLSAVQARLFYDYISLADPVFQRLNPLLKGIQDGMSST